MRFIYCVMFSLKFIIPKGAQRSLYSDMDKIIADMANIVKAVVKI
jgi:hypothetical protein